MTAPAGPGAGAGITLDGSPLSVTDVVAVARHGAPVTVAPGAAAR